MLLASLLLGGIVVSLMIPAGYVHVKLAIAAGVFLLLGLWRLLRAPWWVRRPDEIERLDAVGGRMEVVMRGGRLYQLPVWEGEREELEHAIQQRANAILLRARVVRSGSK